MNWNNKGWEIIDDLLYMDGNVITQSNYHNSYRIRFYEWWALPEENEDTTVAIWRIKHLKQPTQ